MLKKLIQIFILSTLAPSVSVQTEKQVCPKPLFSAIDHNILATICEYLSDIQTGEYGYMNRLHEALDRSDNRFRFTAPTPLAPHPALLAAIRGARPPAQLHIPSPLSDRSTNTLSPYPRIKIPSPGLFLRFIGNISRYYEHIEDEYSDHSDYWSRVEETASEINRSYGGAMVPDIYFQAAARKLDTKEAKKDMREITVKMFMTILKLTGKQTPLLPMIILNASDIRTIITWKNDETGMYDLIKTAYEVEHRELMLKLVKETVTMVGVCTSISIGAIKAFYDHQDQETLDMALELADFEKEDNPIKFRFKEKIEIAKMYHYIQQTEKAERHLGDLLFGSSKSEYYLLIEAAHSLGFTEICQEAIWLSPNHIVDEDDYINTYETIMKLNDTKGAKHVIQGTLSILENREHRITPSFIRRINSDASAIQYEDSRLKKYMEKYCKRDRRR